MVCSEIDFLLLQSNPQKYLSIYLKTIDDLIDNISIISEIKYDTINRDRIILLLCNYILSEDRNKKEIAKRILYKIIKYSDSYVKDIQIIDLLFMVFKKYAFKETNESWKISLFLKDLTLNTNQISWLLDNYTKSNLILNRILRYPIKNDQLQSWAEKSIKSNIIIKERFSEQLGLALTESNYHIFFIQKDISTNNFAWAIYYSKISNKYSLLEKLLYRDKRCLDISKVALRLNFPDIIEKQSRLL